MLTNSVEHFAAKITGAHPE